MRRTDSLEKTLMLGKIEDQRRKERIHGLEFEQAPGVGDGQGSLKCCSPWGCKESDTTERLLFLIGLFILALGLQGGQKEISPGYSLEGLMLKLKL